MTEIDFYILSNAQSRLDFASRLCNKVYQLGHKVFIYTEDTLQSQQLSQVLWDLKPESFLANDIIDTEQGEARQNSSHSPIQISHNICKDSAPRLENEVLINLSLDIPPIFSRFKRSVEIIDNNEESKEKLRENYRFYQQRGYPLKTHKL